MSNLFKDWPTFNQPLNWKTRNVTNMNSMFAGCREFKWKQKQNKKHKKKKQSKFHQKNTIFILTLIFDDFIDAFICTGVAKSAPPPPNPTMPL